MTRTTIVSFDLDGALDALNHPSGTPNFSFGFAPWPIRNPDCNHNCLVDDHPNLIQLLTGKLRIK